MKFIRPLSLIFLTLIIGLILSACSGTDSEGTENVLKVENGKLDLTGWDMNKTGSFQLNGTWEFYWNRLLESKDLPFVKPDLLAEVPNTWNSYSINGGNLPGEGFATYRLHVVTDLPENTMLGLRIYNFSSAYKLYINDKLTASRGRVAVLAEDEIGDYEPGAVIFNIPAKDFDIIIQVSNHQYARGGFWYTMSLGNADGIIRLNNLMIGKEALLGGILLILFLFYLMVYLLRRELKYSLYFAMMCIFMFFALDMVGQFILLRLIPGINLRYVILIWYTSTTWVVFFFILYIYELFKSRYSSVIMKVYLWSAVFFQIIFLTTPTTFYTEFGRICDILDAAGILFTIMAAIWGIKKGKKDGWLNIASMVIVAFTFIYDNLYWTNVITNSFGESLYIGIILFLFLQMIIQAQRIKRTDENKTAAELSFLQAQIKPHFLYNTLNAVISISRYDMDKTRVLLYNFSNYLRKSFDFKELSQFVPLKSEVELAMAYIEIEKARFEDRINVNFQLPGYLNIKVPRLILQPLIENAVIHGILPKSGNGRIDISIKQEGKKLLFIVKDDGVGMNTVKAISIDNKDEKGVGLSNINTRLIKLYGKGLQINSTPGSGTEISWFTQIK